MREDYGNYGRHGNHGQRRDPGKRDGVLAPPDRLGGGEGLVEPPSMKVLEARMRETLDGLGIEFVSFEPDEKQEKDTISGVLTFRPPIQITIPLDVQPTAPEEE